ncbi:helix-turn-helix transcriptional regulator [Halopseudomonas pelagia]|uniref:AraC family transcriptional regulator n=1 Tax=Halopseudomonas pelagia TaxID=553151 RepID=A0AA91TZG3_9GAMM|nr:helix-turn-helix domain-containing protein [Halopseudomonas pelagia]PCC97799.1 hypothetical protein CO192_19065 [Halopseudomonas pelagia]QFY57353.1 AraC family transcriptional regulator [Halopseudomonas pelagia]
MQPKEYVLIIVRNIQNRVDNDFHHALRQAGYRVEIVPSGQDPVPLMQAHPPVAACFQFDYPDFEGLASLRETKTAMPSVPLLMITQAHSESLAVWAFRARVWDYFVQPIDIPRLMEVAAKLYRLHLPQKSRPPRHDAAQIRNQIPPEARTHCSTLLDDQALLQRIVSFTDQNLHRKIAQSEVANLCTMSCFQLSRFFKRVTGVTFQGYLLHRRINEAMRLLANPKVSITDVCFTVGFGDLSYFTRTFQRYVGMPPSRFRLEATELASTRQSAQISSVPTALPSVLDPVEGPYP